MKNGPIYKYEEELLAGFRELPSDDQEELLAILGLKLQRQRKKIPERSSISTDEILA